MNKLSTCKRRKKHIKERKKDIYYKMNKLSTCKRRKKHIKERKKE